MKIIILVAALCVLLSGCGSSLTGTYKLDLATPNLSGLPLPAVQQAQFNQVMEAQKTVLEFGPGRNVTLKAAGVGTETKYTIKGKTLRIELPQNTFMELTIEGETLIGPMGMRYVKQ